MENIFLTLTVIGVAIVCLGVAVPVMEGIEKQMPSMSNCSTSPIYSGELVTNALVNNTNYTLLHPPIVLTDPFRIYNATGDLLQ